MGDPIFSADFNRMYKAKAVYTGFLTQGTVSEETYYVGKDYEYIEKSTGEITHRYHISAGSHQIQIERSDGSDIDQPKYLLGDNLGSTNVIIDKYGEVEQRMEFDPWGMRTEASPLLNGDLPKTNVVNEVTNRGYTGHEMDDEVGLINMNARIYDPYLGRFLSADPVLPDAGDMQAFNRYAYVLNNPLKYTDPTGHFGVDATISFGVEATTVAANPVAFVIGLLLGGSNSHPCAGGSAGSRSAGCVEARAAERAENGEPTKPPSYYLRRGLPVPTDGGDEEGMVDGDGSVQGEGPTIQVGVLFQGGGGNGSFNPVIGLGEGFVNAAETENQIPVTATDTLALFLHLRISELLIGEGFHNDATQRGRGFTHIRARHQLGAGVSEGEFIGGIINSVTTRRGFQQNFADLINTSSILSIDVNRDENGGLRGLVRNPPNN